MATVLPPDFNMLKQRASQPNYELSPEEQSVFDEFFTSLGSSQPAQTKATRTQDIQGQRAYVMPEGPVVYASREPEPVAQQPEPVPTQEPQPVAQAEPTPQPVAQPEQPVATAAPAQEPTAVSAPAPTQQPYAAQPTTTPPVATPEAAPIVAQPTSQMQPESTGYSTPVYQQPSIPPVVMPMLPKVQDMTRQQMLQAPALAGPGAGRRSLAAQGTQQAEIPPPPESQKVVPIPEQKRQRKAAPTTTTTTTPPVQGGATATPVQGAPKAGGPTAPATKEEKAGAAKPGAAKPETAAPGAAKPGAVEEGAQGAPLTPEYWRQQMYPEQTQEQKDARINKAMEMAEPMKALQPQVLPQTFKTREQKPRPAAPPAPPAPAADTTKPTSQLPPMFDQLKKSVEKVSTVSPALYADLGDVSYDQGSMQVEMPDGSKLPARKSPDGWQVMIDNDWTTIDKSSALHGALDKEGSPAQAATTPIGAINGAPLFVDPSTDDDYNLGTDVLPVKRKLAIGPSLAPQFVSGSYGVNAMTPKGPGDFAENWDEPGSKKYNDMVNMMRQAESVFDKTSDNFAVLINDDGKPYVAPFEDAVRDTEERLSLDYLQKTSTTSRLQKRNYGPEGIKATKEVFKQLVDRQGSLLGLSTALSATSGEKLQLEIAELTSKRAKSSGSMQQSESASGGVTGIGADTDYVLQKIAESYTAGEAFQGSNKQYNALDPGYIPGTRQYDSITPAMVGAALKEAHNGFMDFVALHPYAETQDPINNFKLAYETINRLQASNAPADRQELANFLSAFVNRWIPDVTGGALPARVKPYEMGVTATPERERINVQGSGSENQSVQRGESAPGVSRAPAQPGDPRDFENNTFKSVDEALAKYAVDAPKTLGQDAENLTNLLAYMKDPESRDSKANQARASAAMNGLSRLSDLARNKSEDEVARVVAANIQNHMNTLVQNIALLANQVDPNTKQSKLTDKVAKDLYSGIDLIYGANKPGWLTGWEALKQSLMSSQPGIDYVQDTSKLKDTPGVKYITQSIRNYSDPKSSHPMNEDTYRKLGASTFGAPNSQFVVNIFKQFGGSASDAQSFRNFFGLMMSGRSAQSVESDVNTKLTSKTKDYRVKN